MFIFNSVLSGRKSTTIRQESRAVAREPRDAAVVFGLKITDNIHNKFKSSQASKAELQNSKCTRTKQNLTTQNVLGHVFWSQWKGDKGLSNIK